MIDMTDNHPTPDQRAKQNCTCTDTCARRGRPFPAEWSWRCQGFPYVPTELDKYEQAMSERDQQPTAVPSNQQANQLRRHAGYIEQQFPQTAWAMRQIASELEGSIVGTSAPPTVKCRRWIAVNAKGLPYGAAWSEASDAEDERVECDIDFPDEAPHRVVEIEVSIPAKKASEQRGESRAEFERDRGFMREIPCGNPAMVTPESYAGCKKSDGHEGECSAQNGTLPQEEKNDGTV